MAKRQRGFAAMDEKRQREIARKGGRAAHQRGTAHEFSSDEARAAGRKGGRAVSRDRRHMAEIGRKGGRAAHQRGTAHEWDQREAARAGRKGGRRVLAAANPAKGGRSSGSQRTRVNKAKAHPKAGRSRGAASPSRQARSSGRGQKKR
jgi:general stress protein YciG